MEETHRTIARLYDTFLAAGYAELAHDPAEYPPPTVVPQLLERHGIVQEGRSVLDLACGPGYLKEYTAFGRYVGVDISPKMLAAAGKAGYDELVETDILSYVRSAPSRSFDVAVCLSASYFLSPVECGELLEGLSRIAGDCWLITFDGVPDALAATYAARGMPIFSHLGREVPGAIERLTVPGWRAEGSGERVPMEFVLAGPVDSADGRA